MAAPSATEEDSIGYNSMRTMSFQAGWQAESLRFFQCERGLAKRVLLPAGERNLREGNTLPNHVDQ